MRVLLISPAVGFERAFPLGPAQLAAALRRDGIEVTGHDAGWDGLDSLAGTIRRERPDLVGLSVWATTLPGAREAASVVRAHTGAPLVIGGPHPTIFPGKSLLDLGADVAVVGDGEATLCELVRAHASGHGPDSVAGVVWRDAGGRIHHNPARAPGDVDALPWPDREVFDAGRYGRPWSRRGPRLLPVITSRGCPERCPHCSSPALHAGRWRPRSVDDVADEVQDLRQRLDVDGVALEDDHLTADRDRVLALCAALQERCPGLIWTCPNGLRPETLDEDLLHTMAAAGCSRIALGLESAEPPVLERLGRCGDPGVSRRAVTAAHRAGIQVTGYFLLGAPGEGPGGAIRTWREAVRLDLDQVHFSAYRPIPGAALHPDATEGGGPGASGSLRGALYLAYYGHPRRLRAAMAASGAGAGDLASAAGRLGRWLALHWTG